MSELQLEGVKFRGINQHGHLMVSSEGVAILDIDDAIRIIEHLKKEFGLDSEGKEAQER